MNNQTHNALLRKMLVILMAFIVVMTYFPLDGYAANGWRVGSKAVFYNGNDLVGSDGRKFYNDSRLYTNRWYTDSGLHTENCYAQQGPRHTYLIRPSEGGTGMQGYCLEQDVDNPSSGNTKYVAQKWKDAKWMKVYSEAIQEGIRLALLYGKQPDSRERDIEKLFGVTGANLADWYVATQQIIWEFQQGLRTNVASIPENVNANNLGTKSYGNTPKDFFFTTVKGRKAAQVYFGMLKAMRTHKLRPSFTGLSVKQAKNITMEEVSSGLWRSVNPKYAGLNETDKAAARTNADYYLLTDTKNCKQGLKVMNGESKDSAYKFIQQGDGSNKYILEYKGTSLPTTAKHGKKNVMETTSEDLLTWHAPSEHYQTLAIGGDDPVDFYFKMRTPTAIAPGEPGEIEFFPELSFPVHKDDANPGWDNDKCTGMGDAALDSTFELYRDGELVDSITLDTYGSTDYLTDIPWQDAAEISSTSYGTYNHIETEMQGEPPQEVVTHQCTVTPTDKKWDAVVNYTIKEIPPEGRFNENPIKTRTYKVTYHAQTHNSQTCTENPTNWSAVQYKVDFQDNGTIRTVQGTAESGAVDLAYVHEFTTQTYFNDNYRGLLELIKTKNDLNPFTTGETSENGLKTESTNSKWTIELKSGGYENNPYVRVVALNPGEPDYDRLANNYKATRDGSGTPADLNNPLTVNNFGKIRITDLPYGTYIVKEISADNNGYVLESFEINIDTDGKLISKKVNNKAKTNKIKIVKTNNETGKTVRWDAERTAFRLRYLGHSEYGDPRNVENYGKLLPNGANYADTNNNYIFYANANGEITLPYDIEYGHYQIEELVVPNGYFVGQYDNTGKGTIADMGKVNIINHQGQEVTAPKDFATCVLIRDAAGNKVENFVGDERTVYNTYGFSVLEQDAHEDGADYITYYAVVNLPNNPVKGKLEITKDGEGHIGWNKGSDGGYSVWKAVWDRITLQNAKFEIYAAQDIVQSDGVIPIKAYDAKTNSKIDLNRVSRDNSNINGAKEVFEINLDTGELLTQVYAREISSINKTITNYIISATNGATYKDVFTVRDEVNKVSYNYSVEYGLNYSKGGFNYTDVHIVKKTISDDYVPSIAITKPILTSGAIELSFATMNYDGGNMVKMNRLATEATAEEDEVSGYYSDYDKINAVVVAPLVETVQVEDNTKPQNPDGSYPTKEEQQVINAPIVPDGWAKANNAWNISNTDDKAFIISKAGEYKIYVNDGGNIWASCDANGNTYKSYTQEYYFTTVQHYNNPDGFEFSWDDVIGLTSKINLTEQSSITSIKNHSGSTPTISQSTGIYTNEVIGENTVFTGNPQDNAPVYFKTHDGIRTEMYLSGMLAHTKITITQSQLYTYDKVLPAIMYEGEEIKWKKDLTPDIPYFEEIENEKNYVKAERHEVSPTNDEVYYTIDIATDNTDANNGYKIVYPDTTECTPIVTNLGRSAELVFTSVNDTTIYPLGKPVETLTTNINGVAESSALPLGTYWVREVSSTEGHVNEGQWQKFELTYDNQYTPLVWDTASFANAAVSVKIDLEKLFETGYETGNYSAGSGAVFGIYTAEEITANTTSNKTVDTKSVKADTLVSRMVVANGHATSTVKLPLGRYYVKELSAPANYKLNGTKYYFNAVDLLQAAQMDFEYKEIGVSGFAYQDGNNATVIDFDVLEKFPCATVNIDGTNYKMDSSITSGDITVTAMEGRSNVKIKVNDGQSSVIRLENGATMKVSAIGQTYIAELIGTAPTALSTGTGGNENFDVINDAGKVTIKYTPKVTKTTWLSEVAYRYVEPEENATAEQQSKLTELKLVAPEGTTLTAKVDYEYGKAILSYDKSLVRSITLDDNVINVEDTTTMERIVRTQGANPQDPPMVTTKAVKAVVNFTDGTSYTLQFDKTGNFVISASGEVDKNLQTESILTVDGNENLPKTVTLKNTTAKTYARNNSSAGVLNITINNVKNNRLPDEPYIPGQPQIKSILEILKVDSNTNEPLALAEFEIYSSKDNSGKLVRDKLIFTGITDSTGKITISNLDSGTYFYREIKAPLNYKLDKTYYKVEIKDGETVKKITMVNTKEEIKEDKVGKVELSSDDNPIVIPDGDIDITPTIPRDPDNPKTGDNSNMTMYILLLLAALIALLATAIRCPKKRKNK